MGRTDPLRVFSENLDADEPSYMVFAVTGEGGVGKSALLKQYESIARSKNPPVRVVLCDDHHPSPAAVMGQVAAELAKEGIQLKAFDERLRKYRELCQQIEGDPKVPRTWVDLLAHGVTSFTLGSLRTLPGVGPLVDLADKQAAGEALAQLAHYGIER